MQNKATTPKPASTLAVVATATSLSGIEYFGSLYGIRGMNEEKLKGKTDVVK